MKSSFNARSIIGRIKLWLPERPREVIHLRNLVTYQGADVISGLLAGKPDYRLAGIWFEFNNAASDVPVTPGRADTAVSVTTAATALLQRDIMLGRLVASPVLTATTANYVGNNGTYHALTSGATGVVRGTAFGATSKVIGVCLVALPSDGSTLVYARAAVDPVLTVGSSGQVAAAWTTEII